MLKNPWIRLLLAALGVVLLVGLLRALESVLISFGLGFALAYLLNPGVNLLERGFQDFLGKIPFVGTRVRPRFLAVAVLTVAFLFTVAAFLLLVVPAAVDQVKDTVARLPQWADTLKGRVAPLIEDLNIHYPAEVEMVRQRIREEVRQRLPNLVTPLGMIVGQVFSSALALVLFLIHVVVIPVFAFYLLSDMNEIQERWRVLVPPRHRDYVVTRVREIDHLLSAFIQGQLVVCFIMGVFYGVALTLLRVPMGLLVGFVTSFFSLVPYMSTVVGLPLVVVLSLLDQHSGTAAAQVAVVYILGHIVEGHFITPRIMGGRLGLHPVVVMLAVLVWGTLFGFVGMLIAVPVTAALSVFWGDFKEAYKQSSFYGAA